MPSHYIPPLNYQSQGLSFNDWISLLTLCLAPLIAHIASGAPQPSYLGLEGPKWHDRLVLYNPTSIIWRYIAITDRRIRVRFWGVADLAATNALFWTTERKWDGTENTIASSIPYLVRAPGHSRVELLSWDTVKTAIISLQGAQAISILPVISPSSGGNGANGLDTVFQPLAILGLYRLCAALWLTDNFTFTYRENTAQELINMRQLEPNNTGERRSSVTLDSLLEHPATENFLGRVCIRGFSCWGSRMFRFVAVLPLIGLSALVSYNIWEAMLFLAVSSFFQNVFYLFLLGASIIILTYYFLRGYSTTVIPCASSVWYKIYTLAIMIMIVVLLILAAIESRKTPCGIYTTNPEWADKIACEALTVRIKANWTTSFRFSKPYDETTAPSTGYNGTEDGEKVYWDWVGTCMVTPRKSKGGGDG